MRDLTAMRQVAAWHHFGARGEYVVSVTLWPLHPGASGHKSGLETELLLRPAVLGLRSVVSGDWTAQSGHCIDWTAQSGLGIDWTAQSGFGIDWTAQSGLCIDCTVRSLNRLDCTVRSRYRLDCTVRSLY
jgi:hypothetical protein